MSPPLPRQNSDQDGFTTGQFVMASTDARGARDGIALTSQVKYMRDGMERIGHTPALILIVVDEDELSGAVARVQEAMER